MKTRRQPGRRPRRQTTGEQQAPERASGEETRATEEARSAEAAPTGLTRLKTRGL